MSAWFGSGAGLIVIGLAWIIMKFHDDLPRAAQSHAMRAAIVLMVIGACAIAVCPAGLWVGDMLANVIGWGGNTGWAIATVAGLFLVALVAFGTWKRPSPKVAYVGAFVALSLPLFSAGFLHKIDTTIKDPALQVSNQLQLQLNGNEKASK